MSVDKLIKRIVATPEICGGQPRIEGHRISVKDVVKWFEILGMKADEIANEYELNLADIYLALAYYHANQETLQKEWTKEDRLIKEIKSKTTSQLTKYRQIGKA